MAALTTVDTMEGLVAAIGPRRAGGRAVALVGGADAMEPERTAVVGAFFANLAAAAAMTDCCIVDGGTDSGVMRLVGAARLASGSGFRLIGVVPRGRLDPGSGSGSPVRLALDHPELLLVPGVAFGDESPWLFAAADHLAGGLAATIVVNGGRLTLIEALGRLSRGAPAVVVAGSGRAADLLAAARGHGGGGWPDAASLGAFGFGTDEPIAPPRADLIRVLEVGADRDAIAAALGAVRAGDGQESEEVG